MTHEHLQLQIDGIESNIRQIDDMIHNAESDTEIKTLIRYRNESIELLMTLQKI
jgi:hypothetical protein